MRRRTFIAGLGSAAAWPVVARAQQGGRLRRITMITGIAETDPDYQSSLAVFQQELQQLGWMDKINIQYQYRSGWIASESVRRQASEVVALNPDVIVVTGFRNVEALQQVTRNIPIVFVGLTDPVGAGLVESLARPGANTTGFTSFEYGLSAKWVELLKQIAPRVERVGVVREQGSAVGIGFWAAMQVAGPTLGVELRPIGARNRPEVERGVASFANGSNSGLVVTLGGLTIIHRELISKLAAQYQMPAIYPYRYFITSGGLISYGPDLGDQSRRAAAYLDRILKGETPADLPVQAPTKYELVINLKTAKELGLQVPQSLLARADEVIE